MKISIIAVVMAALICFIIEFRHRLFASPGGPREKSSFLGCFLKGLIGLVVVFVIGVLAIHFLGSNDQAPTLETAQDNPMASMEQSVGQGSLPGARPPEATAMGGNDGDRIPATPSAAEGTVQDRVSATSSAAGTADSGTGSPAIQEGRLIPADEDDPRFKASRSSQFVTESVDRLEPTDAAKEPGPKDTQTDAAIPPQPAAPATGASEPRSAGQEVKPMVGQAPAADGTAPETPGTVQTAQVQPASGQTGQEHAVAAGAAGSSGTYTRRVEVLEEKGEKPITILIGSYSTREKALEVAARFKAKGEDVFTSFYTDPYEGTRNQVFIGNFSTMEEASIKEANLRARQFRQVDVTDRMFAVQIGGCNSLTESDALRKKLMEKGHAAYGKSCEDQKGRDRVLVGAFLNDKMAEEMALSLMQDPEFTDVKIVLR
ncbi:MAG: SPOR domain-containing protein [Pseudomonadota bacterium]